MTKKTSLTSPLLDLGPLNGHRVQAEAARHVLLVDGEIALLCSRRNYALALQFLRAPAGVAIPMETLLALDGGASPSTLRHRIATLRRVLAPLGITIVRVTTYGYMAVSEQPSDEQARKDNDV